MDTGKIKIRNMKVEDIENGMKAFEGEYDHFDAPATVRVYFKTNQSAFFVASIMETSGTVNSEKIVGIIGAPIQCNTSFIGNISLEAIFQYPKAINLFSRPVWCFTKISWHGCWRFTFQ